MHVSAVSEPQSYLPVGIVYNRPTASPINAVRRDTPAPAQQSSADGEVPGAKLLLDLGLIAPRQTDSARSVSDGAPTGRAHECETCSRRRYQDKSDDASVSFQTPTHLSPTEAEVMVRVHEQEHVQHERSKAEREGKEVKTRVSIRYSICPECGRVYCSGGTTHVTTREAVDPAAEPAGSVLEPEAAVSASGVPVGPTSGVPVGPTSGVPVGPTSGVDLVA